MAKRMRTVLKEWREQSGDYHPRTWCWVGDCWRPVKNHRFISRGKKKGWVEVELHWPIGKTVTVPATSMKFPTNLQKSAK